MNPAQHPSLGKILIPPVPRWAGFVAMCVGMAMAILDIQVVATSLPVIEDKLGIGADQMSWIQTAYLIAEVIAIPATGLLLRVFTMRWLFVAGIAAFTLASIGCGLSTGFTDLLLFRIFQGFAGGVLIPIVFSAIFLLFPVGLEQTMATTIAGFLAVLAPTVGPYVGGWLTVHYSWHWLFFINIVPGILALLAGYVTLPRLNIKLSELKGLDWWSLVLMGVALAALLIGLKEAPAHGWHAANFVVSLLNPERSDAGVPINDVLAWFADRDWSNTNIFSGNALLWFTVALLAAWALWKRPNPAIMFHLLEDRALLFGCILSFLIGFVLYGQVYLLPVFMAFVRQHTPLEIGITTMVMGLTQLIAAPICVQIDRHFNARWLSALGFMGFGIGLYMNAHLTVSSDYNEHFWPQVVRGVASGLCVLPPIRFALALMPLDKVGDASGLFNVARNIGGAIGIAVIDTLMFARGPTHADEIMGWLKTDPTKAAGLMEMKVDELPALDDPSGLMGIGDSITAASSTLAINECWLLMALVCLLSLPVILAMGPLKSALPPKQLAKVQLEEAAKT